jgi:hypothetical protein
MRCGCFHEIWVHCKHISRSRAPIWPHFPPKNYIDTLSIQFLFIYMILGFNITSFTPKNIHPRVISTRRDFKVRRLHTDFLARVWGRGKNRTKHSPLTCFMTRDKPYQGRGLWGTVLNDSFERIWNNKVAGPHDRFSLSKIEDRMNNLTGRVQMVLINIV